MYDGILVQAPEYTPYHHHSEAYDERVEAMAQGMETESAENEKLANEAETEK